LTRPNVKHIIYPDFTIWTRLCACITN